jgi:fructose 1,6-bisphosphate aldolase/phosphatase
MSWDFPRAPAGSITSPEPSRKKDPVMLVRSQGIFPATGEVLAPFSIGHFVVGCMRGSHTAPLMPVALNSPTS